MTICPKQHVLFLLSYDRLSKKPLLFKSFAGLSVEEFDDIYTGKHYSVDLNRYFFMSRLNLLVL